MSKKLLAGIAALFLATGAAHASTRPMDYRCGNIKIRVQVSQPIKDIRFLLIAYQVIIIPKPQLLNGTTQRPFLITFDANG
jgi:hypothetical protein